MRTNPTGELENYEEEQLNKTLGKSLVARLWELLRNTQGVTKDQYLKTVAEDDKYQYVKKS